VSRPRSTAVDSSATVVLATVFATLFFVFGGGFGTTGVFFTPLLDEFGWSRSQVSMLQTGLVLAAGVAVPFVGLLLDRVEAGVVIAAGAGASGLGFVLASQATTFAAMLTAYVVVGLGIGAATLLPCSLVIANWYGARRGLALGVGMAGTSAGGMVMTVVASRVTAAAGWRAAYVALGLPMLAVAPVVLALVTTRPRRAAPPGAVAVEVAPPAGLEVADALRTPAFWLVATAQLCFAFSVSGVNLHVVPHLIGLGYTAERAAELFGLALGLAGAGKLAMGFLGDRLGARWALMLTFVLTAIGLVLLRFAAQPTPAAAFVVVYGFAVGAPLTLVPLLLAESLGLRRFGTLSGLAGVFNVLGGAAGPLLAGRVFDATGSYEAAFTLFTATLVAGALAAGACAPLRAAAPAAAAVPAT
jgi:sugar phosphate permease